MPRLPQNTCFTMIPNFVFDKCLESLSEGELKILMMIYRQTVGFDKKADKISYSQFAAKSGLSRSTISQAVKKLTRKGLVEVDRSRTTHQYTYCLPDTNSQLGSKSEPIAIQNSNHLPVQNSNTQKKTLKEKELNTSSSTDLSDDVRDVSTYWNEVFPNTLDYSNTWLLKQVEKAVTQFTVDQIKEAIFRRNACSYYQEVKANLLNKPSSFFPYHETIANDLKRAPKGIYNYENMINVVTSSNRTTDDFEKVLEIKDKSGNPMWKLKNKTNNTNPVHT